MRELPHNTDQQVRGYLAGALTIVDDLDVPDELRPLAFAKAVDLLAAKQLFLDQSDTSPLAVPAMAVPRGHK